MMADIAQAQRAKPSIQAGLSSISNPYMDIEKFGEGEIKNIQGMENVESQEYKTGLGEFRSQRVGLDTARASELDALGPAQKAPVDKFEHKPKDVSALAGMVMLLGAIGGRKTLHPMTAALNNLTAAMKGQAEGDHDAYVRAAEDYKRNYDLGMAKFKEYEQGKKDIYAKHKGDTAELDKEIRMYELEHKGNVKQLEAQKGDIRKQVQSEKAMMKAQEHHDEWTKTFEEKKNVAAKKEAEKKTLTEETKLSEDALEFDAAMRAKGSTGFAPTGRKESIVMQIAAFNRMVKLAKERGITPEQLLVSRNLQKSLASTLTAQMKVATGQEKIGEKLKLDMGNLEKMIDSGSAGYAKLVNIPINAMREYMSDPKLAPFALQAELVANEFERLMVGNGLSIAMLPVAAQENAEKLLGRNMSPAEIRAVFPTMLADLNNTIVANARVQQSLIDRIAAGGGGTPAGQDAEAIAWAKANPNDPRAKKILSLHKM